jgi:hypothetical protein
MNTIHGLIPAYLLNVHFISICRFPAEKTWRMCSYFKQTINPAHENKK